MSDLYREDPHDPDIVRTPAEISAPPPSAGRTGLWVAIAALLAAAAAVVYVFFFAGRSAQPRQPVAAAQPAVSPSVKPLGSAPENVVVPPLDETDPLVRTLVAQVSFHPRVLSWLATGGLIRNFAVVVTNLAEGPTPAVHLQVFRPSAPFSVRDQSGTLSIDPASYARYDAFAAAVSSVDPAAAARVYSTLKPRLEDAYRELGAPDGTFDRAVERAIVTVLATPIVEDPVRVQHHGVGYAYAAPELEALKPAQKQLLRMGSRNVRAIQSS